MLNVVRNIILEWTCDLEQKGIYDKDMLFTQDEKNTATTVNTTIYNFNAPIKNAQIQDTPTNNSQTLDKNFLNSK